MLKRYFVKSYRNLQETVLLIEDNRSVVVWGNNNQGKTNFLESLFTVINGFSPVQSDRNLLICSDSEEGVIGIEFESTINGEISTSNNQLYIKLTRNGQRYMTFNRQNMLSFLPLKKWIECYFLNADIIRLFQDSAEGRRKTLDECCCIYDKRYRQILKKYRATLKQKNKSLKSGADFSLITTFNQQLAIYAQELLIVRHRVIHQLTPLLTRFLKSNINESIELVAIHYCEKKRFDGELSHYSEWLYAELQSQFQKESLVGYSLLGPHRDDFEIYINNQLLFTSFSRGINRIVALGFNLAIIELKKQFLNTVLLLDDVFAELDDTHKQRLISEMETKAQLIYATVMESDCKFFKNPLVYEVKQGELV